MKSNRSLASLLLLVACLFINGCNYDFPLSATPTRKIDIRLLGDWIAIDPGNERPDIIHVRQFDDFTYVVSLEHDIYRIYHSDFSDTAFLSVQDLNGANRKYLYFTWQLSADATQLTLKGLRTEVVPENAKTPAEIQNLIKQNLANPKLFQDELRFRLQKAKD